MFTLVALAPFVVCDSTQPTLPIYLLKLLLDWSKREMDEINLKLDRIIGIRKLYLLLGVWRLLSASTWREVHGSVPRNIICDTFVFYEVHPWCVLPQNRLLALFIYGKWS